MHMPPAPLSTYDQGITPNLDLFGLQTPDILPVPMTTQDQPLSDPWALQSPGLSNLYRYHIGGSQSHGVDLGSLSGFPAFGLSSSIGATGTVDTQMEDILPQLTEPDIGTASTSIDGFSK